MPGQLNSIEHHMDAHDGAYGPPWAIRATRTSSTTALPACEPGQVCVVVPINQVLRHFDVSLYTCLLRRRCTHLHDTHSALVHIPRVTHSSMAVHIDIR